MLYKASEILRGDHSVLRPLTSQKDLYTACLTLSASKTIVHLPASANVNISLSHRMAKQCWPLPLISDEPAVSNSTSLSEICHSVGADCAADTFGANGAANC